MSTQKVDVLIVGKGAINSNSNAAHILSSNTGITAWSNVSTYATGNVVEYTGNLWRSLQNSNTGNTPASGSSFWELVCPGAQDGDVAIVMAGSNSDIILRKAGVWVSITNTSVSVSIPSNSTNFVWLSVPLSTVSKAFIDYSITRGSNLRNGDLNVITDGSTAQVVEYAINAIGSDAGVTFDAVVSGSNLNFLATTDAQVSNADVTYTLKGWP
jgi:hypothetical protein